MTQPIDHRHDGIAWRERAGVGPVLVCLHGIGSDATSFDALLAHLPIDWRVIAWYAPGYGASEPLTAHWPLASDYAQVVARLTAALPPFHLLGHSLGTLIGAAFAKDHPERLTRLTLAACAQGYGIGRNAPLPAAVQARIDDLDRLGAEAFAQTRAPRLIHAPGDCPVLVADLTAIMARIRPPGYAQAVRMLASGDLCAAAAHIRTPTDVIVGAEDAVTPPAQSARVHAALPNANALIVIPDAGHAVHQQAPAAFATHLKRP